MTKTQPHEQTHDDECPVHDPVTLFKNSAHSRPGMIAKTPIDTPLRSPRGVRNTLQSPFSARRSAALNSSTVGSGPVGSSGGVSFRRCRPQLVQFPVSWVMLGTGPGATTEQGALQCGHLSALCLARSSRQRPTTKNHATRAEHDEQEEPARVHDRLNRGRRSCRRYRASTTILAKNTRNPARNTRAARCSGLGVRGARVVEVLRG